MTNEKTGGPAYPEGESYITTDLAGGTTTHRKGALKQGMTLLDHFAGLSTAHLADGQGYAKDFIEIHMGRPMPSWKDPEFIPYTAAFNAKMKYAEAAAMIAERNKIVNEKP